MKWMYEGKERATILTVALDSPLDFRFLWRARLCANKKRREKGPLFPFFLLSFPISSQSLFFFVPGSDAHGSELRQSAPPVYTYIHIHILSLPSCLSILWLTKCMIF